jgi:hypothetical protein
MVEKHDLKIVAGLAQQTVNTVVELRTRIPEGNKDAQTNGT